MPRRLLFACLSLLATLFAMAAAAPARAQTASSSSGSSSGGSTTGSESISAGVANPERFLYQNGVCNGCAATDVTNSPRPQNLNPEGVNFTDCEQDLRMDFTPTASARRAHCTPAGSSRAPTARSSRRRRRPSR
jgi:hypothetical protein